MIRMYRRLHGRDYGRRRSARILGVDRWRRGIRWGSVILRDV